MKIKFIALIFSSFFIFTSCENRADKKDNAKEEATQTEKSTTEETQEKPDMHTSQNSLDWAGTYSGVLPCADCPGIETTLKLKDDLTFRLSLFYLERDFLTEEEGEFEWDDDGQRIYLHSKNGNDFGFFVGENFISQLDEDGNRVTGELADKYNLIKATR